MVKHVIAFAYNWISENIIIIVNSIFRYWNIYIYIYIKIDLCNTSWEKTKNKILFSCVNPIVASYPLPFLIPFATLIRVNRWGNWGKGLPWIGVAVKKEREWVKERERERERKRDRPFRNFISTRLHLRDSFLNVFSFKMLSDPVAAVKNDRSKSDRLYFAEKWNFILSWNSLTNAFFITIAIETGYFGWRNKFRGTYFYRWSLSTINVRSYYSDTAIFL